MSQVDNAQDILDHALTFQNFVNLLGSYIDESAPFQTYLGAVNQLQGYISTIDSALPMTEQGANALTQVSASFSVVSLSLVCCRSFVCLQHSKMCAGFTSGLASRKDSRRRFIRAQARALSPGSLAVACIGSTDLQLILNVGSSIVSAQSVASQSGQYVQPTKQLSQKSGTVSCLCFRSPTSCVSDCVVRDAAGFHHNEHRCQHASAGRFVQRQQFGSEHQHAVQRNRNQ